MQMACRYFDLAGVDDSFAPKPNGKVIQGRVRRDEWDIFISKKGIVSQVWRDGIELARDGFSATPAQFLTTFGLRLFVLERFSLTTGYSDWYPDLNNVTLENLKTVISDLQLFWRGKYPDNQQGIQEFYFY